MDYEHVKKQLGYGIQTESKDNAIKALEQLQAKVAELEAENARLSEVVESNIDDGINKIMAMSDEQVSALAGFEGSNPEDKATIARQCVDIAMLRVDLAAAQEQIANETAEACAKACEDVIGNTPHDQRMLAAIDCAVMLRSGAWKEFKK